MHKANTVPPQYVLFHCALCLLYIACCLEYFHGHFHMIVKDNFSMSKDKVPVLVKSRKINGCAGLDWILLARDRDKSWAFVKTTMEL